MLIGELSRRSGVSVRMLRHYDRVGLVSPSGRSAAGYREYDEADARRLLRAESLRTLGLTLAQVTDALDDPGFDAARMIASLQRDVEARIARERELLERLRGIGSGEPRTWEEALELLGLLSALRSGSAHDRYAAALSAGSGSARAEESIVEAYLDEAEPNASGALRWALARAGEPAARILAERTRDADPIVRHRAVLALGDFDEPFVDEALAAVQGDPDADVAGRAAVLLAARERAIDRSPGVRGAVVARLLEMIVSGFRDVEASEALGAIAARSSAREREVLDALARRLAGNPSHPGARPRLVQALGEFDGEPVARLLRALVDDEDPAVSRIARYLLQR